jgi:flavodoxin
MANKSLVILYSYHHKNTEKIAGVIAGVLNAQIKTLSEINPVELQGYSLIGFGSGIYDGKHHQSLLDLADRMPPVTGKQAFIFSTCGVPAIGMNDEYVAKNHAQLREKLQAKGYVITGEFGCVGLNTNSFLKSFGGINKGRPNAEDLRHAEDFAQKLKEKSG